MSDVSRADVVEALEAIDGRRIGFSLRPLVEAARLWLEGVTTPVGAVEEFGAEELYDALGIPRDRWNPWHVLTVKANAWHMAHPITCELATCSFDAQASEWEAPPAEPGVYQWDDHGWRRDGEQ